MNCKVCGKKSESEYCFIHKPKKAIPKTIQNGKWCICKRWKLKQ